MAKKEEFIYCDREQLDAELASAISDIRSAEAEAKRIVEQAEASVKAVQLDGAARERALREQSGKTIAAARERALSDALEKAKAERANKLAQAEAESNKLISSKRELIDSRVNELYASLIGSEIKTAKSAKAPRKTRAKKVE